MPTHFIAQDEVVGMRTRYQHSFYQTHHQAMLALSKILDDGIFTELDEPEIDYCRRTEQWAISFVVA